MPASSPVRWLLCALAVATLSALSYATFQVALVLYELNQFLDWLQEIGETYT